MDNILLLLITIVPSVAICLIIYSIDKKKEPSRLMMKLFMSGVGAALLAIILSSIIILIFPKLNISDYSKLSFIKLILYTTLMIGLIEESCKWLFTYKIGVRNEEFDQPFDAVVYAVLVSLGFALFENIYYVLTFGKDIAVLRAITTIPAHFTMALFMGYFIAYSRYLKENKKNSKIYFISSIIVPIIIHAVYDFIAIKMNSLIVLYLYLGIMMIIGIFLIIKLKKLPNYQASSKKTYCFRCGNEITGNVCDRCGNIIS